MKFFDLKKLRIILLASMIYIVSTIAFEVDKNGICQIEQDLFPAIGFGTYPLKDDICENAVQCAANLGYRIIDTATYYRNFESISIALKALGRQNFYIISKVWPSEHTIQGLYKDINETLAKLKTSYLDAYLLHWPNSKMSIDKILVTMEEFRIKGFIRHIGLSNVTVNHLKRALEVGIKISWVQIEMHPHFYDRELLEFCKKNSITIQAWRPLNLGSVNQDQLLIQLGKKYQKSPCQISLRWILQHECISLPGSKDERHIQENFNIMDFALSQDDMNKINTMASAGKRFRLKEKHGLGFTDEFDFSYNECWPEKATGS